MIFYDLECFFWNIEFECGGGGLSVRFKTIDNVIYVATNLYCKQE